jgi:hypothetical protein
MQQLEAEIKRLEAEYNMFFAGRLPRLPWETRARVDTMVKQIDRSPMQNTAERFRFNTLQSRFSSFCDLWEKQLRAKEEGRMVGGRRASGSSGSAGSSRSMPPADIKPERSGVLHESRIRDPLAEDDRVKELYHQLAEARSKTGEATVPFHRFAEAVRAQVSKLGGGDREVVFRVELKDGKATLAAKSAKSE